MKKIVNTNRKYITDEDFDLFIDKHVNRLSHEELELKYSICKRTVIRRLERIRDILRDNLVWELWKENSNGKIRKRSANQ